MNKVKPAIPRKLPVKVDVGKFATELAEASFELGKLDGLQRDLPNPSLLITPLTTKEATVSSRIEGTRSTVSDVFLYEAIEQSKYDDTIEVVNYKKAMIWAMEELKRRKLNSYFIKELHSILLKQARGEKFRGKFRETQVFIGEKGATIEKATYIPPQPLLVTDYMENLEEYLLTHNENPLIKSAIIHYQFEAIHPFNDGNGRIGRLLVPLYLYQEKLLYQPILFLSGYFDKHKNKYLDMIHLVDKEQKYEDWIKFFLISVKEQSRETQNLIYAIKNLINQVKTKTETIKSLYTSKIIDFIFKRPVFSASELSKSISSNRVTTLRLIKKLENIKIISSFIPPKRKRKIFVFEDLIKLLM